MHLYENHLGGYYVLDEYDESMLETCGQCGDSDWYVGYFEDHKAIARYMVLENATDEHIADVTGYKVTVSYEKVKEVE